MEDHKATRSILERLLDSCGHHVCATGTVNDAVQLLDNFRFDALLSDIGLPDGDGYQVVAEAKKRQALKTVAVTALNGPEDEARAERAGFDHYLQKPLDFSRLQGVLTRN